MTDNRFDDMFPAAPGTDNRDELPERAAKPESFRVQRKTKDSFNALCKERGWTQDSGLSNLIKAFELGLVVDALPERAEEVADIQRKLADLQEAFLHSFELFANAKENARGEFRSMIESQAKTIEDLQTKQAEMEERLALAEEAAEHANMDKLKAESMARSAEQLRDAAQQTAADKQTIADTLASKLAEAETKAREYDGLLREFNQLKEMNRDPDQKLKDIQRDHAEALKDAERRAEREQEAALAKKQLEIEDLREQLRKAKSETESAQRDAENARIIALAELSDEHKAEISSMQDRLNELTDKLMEMVRK